MLTVAGLVSVDTRASISWLLLLHTSVQPISHECRMKDDKLTTITDKYTLFIVRLINMRRFTLLDFHCI